MSQQLTHAEVIEKRCYRVRVDHLSQVWWDDVKEMRPETYRLLKEMLMVYGGPNPGRYITLELDQFLMPISLKCGLHEGASEWHFYGTEDRVVPDGAVLVG
jgi:hypothetical protein